MPKKSRKVWLSAFGLIAVAACLCAAVAETRAPKGLSPKEAQALLRRAAGLDLPSAAVRVKEVSTVGSAAVVVAEIETAFRLKKEEGRWRVVEVRAGDRRWEDLDLLTQALNREKTGRARAELESLAVALESFRRERGFYVTAETVAALTDHLSPRYLARSPRFDPWHQAYRYEGTGALYTLSSDGPDGRAGTADDVIKKSQ